MTFSEKQVEWIVVEVIRRLGLLEGEAVDECNANTTELKVPDQVVTLRLLGGRLSDISRVVVSQRAVVTPAVKDELRMRKIELVRW